MIVIKQLTNELKNNSTNHSYNSDYNNSMITSTSSDGLEGSVVLVLNYTHTKNHLQLTKKSWAATTRLEIA
jgi:hypothetical protein